LKRARKEGIGEVVEGIHVIPGLIEEAYRGAPDVIVAMVSVPDAEEHKRRFLRASRRGSRRENAARYLKNFSAIREIHDFLAEDATKHGIPVMEPDDPDSVASETIERLWRGVLGTIAEGSSPPTEVLREGALSCAVRIESDYTLWAISSGRRPNPRWKPDVAGIHDLERSKEVVWLTRKTDRSCIPRPWSSRGAPTTVRSPRCSPAAGFRRR
jgi:hypothetical protein